MDRSRRGFLALGAWGTVGLACAQSAALTSAWPRHEAVPGGVAQVPLGAAAQRPRAFSGGAPVLVLGDSLSAEYGLARGSGWVALLGERLAKRPRPWQVVNGSISGDTTAGGRSRLPALLKQHRPKVVIIELGGNDALRGLPLSMTQANLGAMVQAAKGDQWTDGTGVRIDGQGNLAVSSSLVA